MNVTDFDYDLPVELIAQHPADKRDESRLLVVDRENNKVYHKKFYEIKGASSACAFFACCSWRSPRGGRP